MPCLGASGSLGWGWGEGWDGEEFAEPDCGAVAVLGADWVGGDADFLPLEVGEDDVLGDVALAGDADGHGVASGAGCEEAFVVRAAAYASFAVLSWDEGSVEQAGEGRAGQWGDGAVTFAVC
mgnify:CR=1 FL=1